MTDATKPDTTSAVDANIEQLTREIDERREKIQALETWKVHQKAGAFEAFEKLSAAEQTAVYRRDPELYHRLMEEKRERAMRRLWKGA